MKRTYHTDIIIQYKLGILPKEILGLIPSSTLHNWGKLDINKLFGMEYAHKSHDNIKMLKDIMNKNRLLKAVRALYYVSGTYEKLLQEVKNPIKLLRDSKELVIKTIDRAREHVGLDRALKAFKVSQQQFYAWKRKINCKIEPATLCRKLNYNQLTFKELNVIKQYLKKPEYLHWSITSVYYQMLRDKAAFFSKSTFYKYVNLFRLTRSRPDKKKYPEGIRATAPNQILHADVTILRTMDNVKLYIYLLVDNFSRYILNWKVSTEYSAKIAFENISEAYHKYGLHKARPMVSLVTDGGSENKGQVEQFVNSPDINMRKIIAQVDIIFSNSIVEAANKRIKYDYLFRQKLSLYTQVKPYMKTFIPDYNNKPHSGLYGLTPGECYAGSLPDKDMFKPAIKASVNKRKQINLDYECENCFGM